MSSYRQQSFNIDHNWEDIIMKLSELIANGTITITISIEDLLGEAPKVIECAKLVNDGLKACTKTLLFPLNVEKLECFSCAEDCGYSDYRGTVSRDGTFTCLEYGEEEYCIGSVNLNNPTDVFTALLPDHDAFARCLKKFLEQQILKA